MGELKFKSTKDIKVSPNIAGQVIGQDSAVNVIRKAAEQRRHVLLIGEPGTGKCVGAKTEIVTTQGPIKAEKLYKELKNDSILLEKGDEQYLVCSKPVYTYTLNKEGKVTKRKIIKAYRGKRKKGIKIRTTSGNKFIVSGEHPVLSIKKNKLVYVPAEELKEGAFIASTRKLPKSENFDIPINNIESDRIIVEGDYFQFKGRNGVLSAKLRLPKTNSSELAYFVGLCVAEARWQGNLVIYNSNKVIKNKIQDVLQNVFEYPKHLIQETDRYISLKKSRTLAHYMERIFDFPLETKRQSTLKKIPTIFFDSSEEIIKGFVSGLIDGDGHIGNRGFEIVSSSKSLITGLKLLLLKMEIQSRISKSIKHAANTREKIKREYYRLNIYDYENIIKLREKIKLCLEYKRENFFSFRKIGNTNVDVIPKIGKEIYDIKNKLSITFEELGYYPATFRKFRTGQRNISRNLAQKIISQLSEHCQSNNQPLVLKTEIGLKQLEMIAHSDIFWDKIRSMSLVEDDLYDFEVEETHNLIISSGIVVHNSMLGLALAELLPKEKLVDLVSFPNPNDENSPLIRSVPAGTGRDLVTRAKLQGMKMFKSQNIILFILVLIAMFTPWWILSHYKEELGATGAAIMFAAFFLGGMIFLGAFVLFVNLGKRMDLAKQTPPPKLIVDNFKKKQAPFFDATGAHAGALLGDVLHDPFQSLNSNDKITIIDKNNIKINIAVNNLVDSLFAKHITKNLNKKQNNYEAIFLQKNELFVLGELNGSISPVEVLSCNRYDYNGKMIKLTTSENKELIVTPEHKIAINKNGKIAYKEAKDIKEGDEAVSKVEDIIIDEQDIINTYDERQQEQCKLYYQYLDIKSKNPTWGYKRIAKLMSQNIGKTRWWHSKKHIPVPIQTANWLKEKRLLPLKINNSKLPLIAKVLGATFGDGGIFENLNGIFLSSSELESVKEFGRDIENIFGLNLNENSRIIEGGEHGHSWCYQNTNRNIIRFFLALGAPKGNKSSLEIKTPSWIKSNDTIEDQFFGSFLGREIGIPKIHVSKVHLNTFDIAITGTSGLEENRYEFLSILRSYLEGKGIKVTSMSKRKTKNENVYLYRLLFSLKIDNLIQFMRNLKLNYCLHKKQKIVNSVNDFLRIKRGRYENLLSRGYGAESCMKLLNLTPNSLYEILNNKKFVLKKLETTI